MRLWYRWKVRLDSSLRPSERGSVDPRREGDGEDLPVAANDGHRFSARLFSGTSRRRRPVVVLLPALGVGASYYYRLAAGFNQRGYDLVVADQRGHGTSDVRPRPGIDYGYLDIIDKDLPALLQVVGRRLPHAPRVLFGHSLGGVLGSMVLAQRPHLAEGLVLVSSSSVHYRNWGRSGPLVYALTTFWGLSARALGFFPGRYLGFGTLESAGLMTDFTRQARTGRYVLSGSYDAESVLAGASLPVLSLSLAGDRIYAPQSAVRDFANKLPRERVRRAHVVIPELVDEQVHFTWVRRPDPVLDRADDFMRRLPAVERTMRSTDSS